MKKGVRLDAARRFTRDAKALGITIHGTFILGLPGETRETIEETIRFAREIDPDTIQVSLAAPYPGTALYEEAQRNGWLEDRRAGRRRGVQMSALGYPHLSRTEIFGSVDQFYRRFYFRPRKMLSLAAEMLRDRQVMRRRLGEGASSSASCAATVIALHLRGPHGPALPRWRRVPGEAPC